MSIKILVVDDEPDIRELVMAVLRPEDENYEFIEAEDGKKALEKAAECKPDIIILDIMMPEMDGHEACRQLRIRSTTKEIPIIFLTVKTEYESREKGFDLGGDAYLTKPFDPAELSALVKGILSGQVKTRRKTSGEP